MAENTEINVLITDDIEDNRLVLKNICRKIQNLRVFEAVNGEQAVETVKKQPIDIVLMDVMMPVMDGFEATGIIKKMENPPTVIVVTAIADKETENKFIELGVDGYIRKPIDRDIIKAKLEGLKNTITLRKGAKTTLSSKKPISKLAKKCRNYKTYFFIENEDDAMDFGLWLTDEKTKIDNSFSFEFEDTLAAIYKICSVSLKAGESVTIVVEGDFENLFATIILPNHISCDTALSKLDKDIRDSVYCEASLIYFVVRKLKQETIKTVDSHIIPTHKEPDTIEQEKQDEDESKERILASEEDMKILRKSHVEKISAEQYVSEISSEGFMDEVYDLSDIEQRWRDTIEASKGAVSKDTLIDLADHSIHEYAKVINKMYEFSAIGYALNSLCAFLKTVDEGVAKENGTKIIMLIGHILDDLANWRNTIFIAKNTNDIHYLDSSLLSSCMQIDALGSSKIADTEDSELELF